MRLAHWIIWPAAPLPRLTVVEQSIGGKAAVDRVEGGYFPGLAPRSADAGGGVDDQAVRLDQSGVNQGLQGENRGGCITTRRRDRYGGADRVAIELGNAVD